LKEVMMSEISNGDRAFIVLVSIFIGSITIASVLANKIITVFGLFVPAGVLAYSITFVCTDVISEMWGKTRAQYAVFGGFVALICVLALVQLSLAWPKAPFWDNEAAFNSVLGSTSRIILASFVAYLVSQYHDVWAFHFWKSLTKDRHLWLRNNLSTAVSQFLDSFIFITIAFYGVMPIWPLIIGQWIIKFAIGVMDTPVVYTVVWLLKKNVVSKKQEVPLPA
jgi:uncharacterized integral membrane protein (TIGR00697 family)